MESDERPSQGRRRPMMFGDTDHSRIPQHPPMTQHGFYPKPFELSLSALKSVFESDNPSYSKRVPNCQKCGQHGQKSRLKGHKRLCPFKDCLCPKVRPNLATFPHFVLLFNFLHFFFILIQSSSSVGFLLFD
ncbi:DM DNA binding domain protein [Ostertagia ostertagi]